MNPHAFPTMPDEAARLYRLNSYTPDLAGEIDSEEEILAEEIGVTPQVAALMLDWVRRNKRDDNLRNEADMLAKVFSTAIPREGKISIQLVGLRFLALYWLLNSTGDSLTALANRAKLGNNERVSKQLLDWHANNLGRTLNFHGYQQKTPGSRVSYAQAQRSAWASLSPEERRQRRAGKGKTPKPKPIQNKQDLIRAKMLELQRKK